MSFLETFKKLAFTVTEALTGPVVPAVVEIGKDVLALIDQAKTVVNTDDAAVLQTIKEDLEPRVMAHADKTEADLRGS